MKEEELIDWIVNCRGWNYWADSPQSQNQIKHNFEGTENDEEDDNDENEDDDSDDDDERCSCVETSLPEGGSRAGLQEGSDPQPRHSFSISLQIRWRFHPNWSETKF